MPKIVQKKTGSRQSKESRINAILEAARSIFEEVGYESAKISDIAKRIGVVEGTVFHYFDSKKLLMVRIIEEFYKEITEESREGLKGISGTRNRLYYIVHFHLGVVTRNSRLCGEILRESRGLDGELANSVSGLNREYTRSLSDVIKDGIESGDIATNTSISLVRNTVYGSIEHTLWAVINDNKKVDVDTEAKALTTVVYQGIKNTNAPNQNEISTLIRNLNRVLKDQR
jgi:AcrR family transcriptional regulator